jgi:hypothetical protein
MFYKGGKEYGPNGQTQGALTGRHHFVMASSSQASRLDTHGILLGADAASIAFVYTKHLVRG